MYPMRVNCRMRRHPVTLLVALAYLALGTPRAAQAQDAREELALGLLRLEYAMRDRPLPATATADVNRAFDRLTLTFFAGRLAQAQHSLDSLALAISAGPDARGRHAREAATTLRDATAAVETIVLGGTPVSVMLHIPPGGGAPRPLIVALHGAGGDERMFFTAYGAGQLRAIADRMGAVVVTPNTMQLGLRAERFPELLDAVAERTAVDRSRVYVVGHSMGAGVTARLASLHPTRIRAVACIAGPCGAPVAGDPPRLVVAGTLDPLAPPARLRPPAGTDSALVSYREATGWGHTLLVGHVLEDTIRWLLSHRTAGSPPA
jgi:predicted esterase